MASLLRYLRVFGETGAVAEEANVKMEVLTIFKQGMSLNEDQRVTRIGSRGIPTLSLDGEQSATRITSGGMSTVMDEEQSVTRITSFIFLIVFSFFLVAFVGFLFTRRSNPRLKNNGNIQGEQPDEEQQMLAANSSEANPECTDHHHQEHRRHCLSTLPTKLNFATALTLLNFILEIPSAVFEQIASDKKPAYVLIVMLISFTSVLVCLVELVCDGRKRRIKWSSGRLPWFYHPPPNNKPFGTLIEMVGLACGIAQCIISTINYSFCRRGHCGHIEISPSPIILSFGLLCSRFIEKPKEDGGESHSTTSNQDGGDVTLAELQQ